MTMTIARWIFESANILLLFLHLWLLLLIATLQICHQFICQRHPQAVFLMYLKTELIFWGHTQTQRWERYSGVGQWREITSVEMVKTRTLAKRRSHLAALWDGYLNFWLVVCPNLEVRCQKKRQSIPIYECIHRIPKKCNELQKCQVYQKCNVLKKWQSAPTGAFSIFLTTNIPSMTLPKTTCLPSRKSHLAAVMKNWHLVWLAQFLYNLEIQGDF